MAINDLGRINWTENVFSYGVRDSSGVGSSFIQLLDDNLDNIVEDTFSDAFDYYELNESYNTNLPTRIIASLIYNPWDEKTDNTYHQL